MGAPSSFTARRPNASTLPTFELPPPHLSNIHQKYQSFPSHHTNGQTSTTLTSVGQLLTPPSNNSQDGLSPGGSAINTSTSSIPQQGAVPPFTPNGGGMWPPPAGTTPYGFQSGSNNNTRTYNSQQPIFSPSLNSLVGQRGNNGMPGSAELPPPPFDYPQYSASMSASSNLPALHTQHQQQQGPPQSQQHQHHQMVGNGMMSNQASVSSAGTQPSPATTQSAFERPPPTPSFYSQPSSASQPPTFPYSAGPSPMHQSPISAGGSLSRMSPHENQGQMPPLQTQPPHYPQHRPYSYPLSGPVLSNINNPHGQLALVGGMGHGMMPPFNSGHAVHMQMYGHHSQQPSQQNDRPFRCDQCPQSFNRNHDLKRHKRIHLAVKPFPCGHCDKSFSRKDALKVCSSRESPLKGFG